MTYGKQQTGIRNIVGFGHSLMAGGGASDSVTRGWGHMLAAILGANFHNYSRGGACALETEGTGADLPGGFSGNNGNGGWAFVLSVLSALVQGTGAAFLGPTPSLVYPQKHSNGIGQPYVPPTYTPLVFLGNNDLGFWGNTTQAMNAFLDAMRAIISRLTAAAVYEENDATVGFNNVFGTTAAQGSWGASLGAGFGLLSGNDARAIPNALTSGSQGITINVPNDLESGDVVVLGFVVNPGATGQVTVAVDGSSAGLPNAGVIDFSNRTAGQAARKTPDQPLPIVYRISGLSGGSMGSGNSHVITINVTSTPVSNVFFDYWQVEPGAQKAPFSAILPSFMHIYQYGIWSPVIVGDTDVDQWNTAYKNMVQNEFPNALFVDILNAIPRASQHPYWYVDQTHLTDAGHALMAETVYDAVATKQLATLPRSLAVANKEIQRTHISKIDIPTAGSNLSVATTTFDPNRQPGGVFPDVFLPCDVGDVIEVGSSLLWDNTGTALGLAEIGVMGGFIGNPVPQISVVAGGSLTVGQAYYYWMSGTNANGESVAGGPYGPFTPTAGNQTIRLVFTPNTNIRIYRTTGTAYPSSGSNFLAAPGVSFGSSNTYNDTGGTALTAGSPPNHNTAWISVIRYIAGGQNNSSAGIPSWVANAGTYEPVTPTNHVFTAIPQDCVGGGIQLRLLVRTNTTVARNIVTTWGGSWWAKNHGRHSMIQVGAS